MSPNGQVSVVSRDRPTTVNEVADGVVIRAGRGDASAFAELVESRVDVMFKTACAILGNEADARDATQEAFLSAWQHLPALRDPERFDAWLHRVLVNRCRDMLRRRARVRELSLDADRSEMAALRDRPTETGIVNAAFDRLSVDDRALLVMHHLHGMSVAAIARRLRVPVGTAKWRLFRARRALERRLEAER